MTRLDCSQFRIDIYLVGLLVVKSRNVRFHIFQIFSEVVNVDGTRNYFYLR